MHLCAAMEQLYLQYITEEADLQYMSIYLHTAMAENAYIMKEG